MKPVRFSFLFAVMSALANAQTTLVLPPPPPPAPPPPPLPTSINIGGATVSPTMISPPTVGAATGVPLQGSNVPPSPSTPAIKVDIPLGGKSH